MSAGKSMGQPSIALCAALLTAVIGAAQERNAPAHQDIQYGPHAQQAFDLWPAETDTPAPLVIFIHGGGFVYGDKALEGAPGPKGPRLRKSILDALLKDGFAVASINYRLPPSREEPQDELFRPLQIADVKAAIRFLRANSGRYGIDPERVGLWGLSAGAALANLAGVTGDLRIWDGEGGNGEVSSAVGAVVSFYGPTTKRMPSNTEVLQYVSQNDPAFLLIHGDVDSTVPFAESERFRDALVQEGHVLGENVILEEVHGVGHGLDDRFDDYVPMGVRFLTRHLREDPVGTP